MLSMGNEQLVALHQPKMLEEHQKMLNEKVDYARKLDPRHLYTCTSHPCTRESNSDYFVSAWTMKGWDAARAGKMTGFLFKRYHVGRPGSPGYLYLLHTAPNACL